VSHDLSDLMLYKHCLLLSMLLNIFVETMIHLSFSGFFDTLFFFQNGLNTAPELTQNRMKLIISNYVNASNK